MLNSISYETAAKALELSVTTKSFKFKISSARQFGLIATSSGETLTFLDTAKAFVFPTEKVDLEQLKLQCFENPRLYGELLELYRDKAIPKQHSLENILTTTFGIAPNAKELAAKVFIETANEVGAIVGGILTLDIQVNSIQDKVNDEEQADLSTITTTTNEEVYTNLQTPENFKFMIPTLGSKTATLLIPNEINTKDIDFINMFIQNMLPAFLENLKNEIEIRQTTE